MDARFLPHLIARLRDRTHLAIKNSYQAGGLSELLPAHGGVLYACHPGPVTMQELAATLDRDNSTMTTLVGKLEERGYLATERSPEDRRTRLVRLTSRGKKARARVMELSRKLTANMLTGLDETEEATLMELLGRVYANLES